MRHTSHSTPVILLAFVQIVVLTVFLADGGTYHLSRTLSALTGAKHTTSTETVTPAKRMPEADSVAAPQEGDAPMYAIGSLDASYAAIEQAGSSAAFTWTNDEPRGRAGSAAATTVALRTADSLPPPPMPKPAVPQNDDSFLPDNVNTGKSGTATLALAAEGSISDSTLLAMEPTRSSALLAIAGTSSSSSSTSSEDTELTTLLPPASSGTSSAESVSSAPSSTPLAPAHIAPDSFSLQLTDLLQTDTGTREHDSTSSIAPLLP